ncbi:MAG: hypothetical protein WC728_10835 [Elusimicrobiota bacterium]
MARHLMAWRFVYNKKGRAVRGYASVGVPRMDKAGLDWEVPVDCDILPRPVAMPGVTRKGSVELAKSFLRKTYAGLNLKKEDGGSFAWDLPPGP